MSFTGTRIGVIVRIRPLLDEELRTGHQNTHIATDSKRQSIIVKSPDQKYQKRFKYDHVFSESVSQKELYEMCGLDALMKKVVEGFNATIFAYGQTGSGKTHTMEGYDYENCKPIIRDDDGVGITFKAIRSVFSELEKGTRFSEFRVYCTYIQIYKERIYDLLNPAQLNSSNPGLKLRWSKTNEFYVENLYNYPCESSQDVISHFHTGLKNKVMASHNLNSASSRSHSILTVTIETMQENGEIVTSKLQLVDLAGSERQAFTGNQGEALKESIEINKSLFTLRQVISSLASQKDGDAAFVPYRDSKLTSLLKQSIGGNSFCLMIACIAPSDQYFDENVSTLTYATKTAHISNEPVQNLDPKTRVVKDLQIEIKDLNLELKKAYQQIDILTEMIVDNRDTSFSQKLQELEKIPLRGGAMDLIRSANVRRNSHTTPVSQQRSITPQKSLKAMSIAAAASESLPAPITTVSSEKFGNGAFELTPQILSEKLYDSVKMIRDLMASNRTLKETINNFSQNKRRSEVEIKQLTIDNQELRERVEMLESLMGDRYPANTENLPNYIQLKRERDELKIRVRQLEIENSNIQNMFKTQISLAAPPPLGPKGEMTWKSKKTIIRPRNAPDAAYSTHFERSQEVPKNIKHLTPLKPLNAGRERAESNQDRNRRTHSSQSVEAEEAMSRDDALKALSQLLLNRAAYTKYKSSSSRPL